MCLIFYYLIRCCCISFWIPTNFNHVKIFDITIFAFAIYYYPVVVLSFGSKKLNRPQFMILLFCFYYSLWFLFLQQSFLYLYYQHKECLVQIRRNSIKFNDISIILIEYIINDSFFRPLLSYFYFHLQTYMTLNIDNYFSCLY